MRDILKKKDAMPAARQGFTLIELLVVIAIVAVLSTLAINGYTGYRRATLLDFSADSIISHFYEFKDKTIHGDYGRGRFEIISEGIAAINAEEDFVDTEDVQIGPKCYGLYFEVGEGKKPMSLEGEYSNKKIPEGPPTTIEDQKWRYEGCESFDSAAKKPLELDEMLSIVDIYDDNGFPLDDFSITFVPPDGQVEVSSSGEKGLVTVVIQYGKSEEDKYKRKIFIDLKSGKAHVTPM